MRDLSGAFTLLTGAAGGLGPVIARTLAAEGCRLALAAHPDDDLGPVVHACRHAGPEAIPFAIDLAEPGAPEELAAQAEAALGGIDVLVNNAGVEKMAAYELLAPADISRMIAVNFTAPLLLIRAVLPGMLQRGRGHVVNLASLAAIGPPPYGAPYGATKAGLLALTRALRTECADRGVSFSAICPGFVADAGMYERMARQTGVESPPLLGTTTTEEVSAAVRRALLDDEPLLIVNPGPVRLMRALDALWPRTSDWVYGAMGVTPVMRRWSDINTGTSAVPEHEAPTT
jgi:short-subunit dehydrogenase